MSEIAAINVLLLSSQLDAAGRWAEMLPPPQFQTVGGPLKKGDRRLTANAPPESATSEFGASPLFQPDVIVTDLAENDCESDSDAGVIRIAAEGPADVALAADFTPRELQLACELLAQVTRLRRHMRWAAERQHELSVAALTDALTGLPNRRAWDDALPRRLAMATQAARPLCLAIFDIDRFKAINDSHGHVLGDTVLREAARALGDSLRTDDFVARLGGDEFGVLLGVRNEEVAAQVVERARRAVAQRLLGTPARGGTASAGYHVARLDRSAPPLPSPADLYAAADAALHAAKRQGRDRSAAG